MIIKSLGIVRMPLLVSRQFIERVLILMRGNIERAEFAQNGSLRVLFVLHDDSLEAAQRVPAASLFERDTPQLEMRIRLARVDRDGVLEPPDRLRVLPALLINQTKLLLRLRIVRIARRRFQVAAEALPPA